MYLIMHNQVDNSNTRLQKYITCGMSLHRESCDGPYITGPHQPQPDKQLQAQDA